VELTKKGVWPPFEKHYATIIEHLNNTIQMEGFHYTEQQVNKKIDKFKSDWKDFSELLDSRIITGGVGTM
jgi:hypothetical protein